MPINNLFNRVFNTPKTTATVTPQAPVTAATTATPAAPAAAAAAAAGPIVGNPDASGAAAVVKSVKLDGGYVPGVNSGTSWLVAGQNVGSLSNGSSAVGVAVAGRGYERGSIEVASVQVDDKHFAIDVKTLHAAPYSGLKGNDDAITLFLETKIQGKDSSGRPAEIVIRLATPHTGAANNVDAYNGAHRFVVSYQELDAALKSHHPDLGILDSKGNFTGGGATIAMRAYWTAGHNWGGYGRLGVTEIPAPAKKSNIASVQAGNVAASAVKIAASDMPVDFEHALPVTVQKRFSSIFNIDKPMTVSTRLERELKGKVDNVTHHEAAIVRMQMIAAGYKPLITEMRSNLATELMSKAKMKPADARAFAEKLHISPHTEWAQKDAGGKYVDSQRFAEYKKDPQKLIDAGLAKTPAEAGEMLAFISTNGVVFHDPMPLEDKYNGTKSEMQKSVIRRVRSNAIAEGVYNVKPGPGMLQAEVDPSTAKEPCGLIRARIEASVELKNKNVSRSDIANYEKSDGSAFNVIGQLLQDAGIYTLGGERYTETAGLDKTPVSFTMMQERHRFDIEVQGMKLDTSIDFVNVDDGGKQVTRQIVEMELEHKFIEPAKVGSAAPAATAAPAAAAAAASSASSASNTPLLQADFRSLSSQQAATAALTDVSLNVPPRFHRLSDLDDKELWETSEQVVANAVTNALINLIYPNGVSPCEQKGVEMARALGKLD